MQNKYSFRYLILLLLCAVCINSCRKETPSWDVDVIAPLIKSTLSVNNIIPDSILAVNPDNSLDIIYDAALTSFATNNLFVFPDTSLNMVFMSPFQILIPGTGSITSATVEHVVLEGGVELKNGIIRSGDMKVSVTSSLKGKVDFSFNVPGLINPSGNIFQTVMTVPAGTTTTAGVYNGIFDLSGYKLNLTGLNGFSVNTLVINYAAVINEPDSILIEAGDSIRFSFSINQIVPQYVKGYFGDTTTSDPDSASFSLFSHIINGTVDIENIDIGLNFENNMGADGVVTVNSLSSVNSKTGNTIPLSHPIIGTPVNITRALDNNGVITPSYYSVALGASNSNIKQFVENLPDSFKIHLTNQINPLGNVSGYNDFGYYEKPMKLYLKMRIPLSLLANNLTMADTVDFKMETNTDNVNHGNLYVYFENGFPFTAEVQLYLMNDNSTIIDSLISAPNSIAAPPLNANLICTGKAETKLTIPMSAEKLNELRSAKKMYIKIKFNTANQPSYVKIYSFYQINVKVVGDFNYTLGKN